MIKTFGIEEAKEASKFATTPEQKRTVLATMAMLGVRNLITKTTTKLLIRSNKKNRKAQERLVRDAGKIAKIRKAGSVVYAKNEKQLTERDRDINTKNEWTV